MGKVLTETAHTITFSPKKSRKEVKLSKRDVAKKNTEQAGTSRQWEPQVSTEKETTRPTSWRTKKTQRYLQRLTSLAPA